MARRDRDEERRLAMARIETLGELADEAARAHAPERAARYLALARRIGMRHQIAIPTHLRRKLCRGCGNYLTPGATARVRLREGRAVTTCLVCGRVERVGTAEAREATSARVRTARRVRRSRQE